jgi:hypothetical protein
VFQARKGKEGVTTMSESRYRQNNAWKHENKTQKKKRKSRTGFGTKGALYSRRPRLPGKSALKTTKNGLTSRANVFLSCNRWRLLNFRRMAGYLRGKQSHSTSPVPTSVSASRELWCKWKTRKYKVMKPVCLRVGGGCQFAGVACTEVLGGTV